MRSTVCLPARGRATLLLSLIFFFGAVLALLTFTIDRSGFRVEAFFTVFALVLFVLFCAFLLTFLLTLLRVVVLALFFLALVLCLLLLPFC
jgi:hypothetical protein